MSAQPTTTITLRALKGAPLAETRVRDMVRANAHAIAERQGVEVLALENQPDRITVTLRAGRIEAFGFAAELRRLTEAWYESKYGGTLWGEAPHADGVDEDDDDDPAEAWKKA
ncbi:MAG: hypothetical protein EA377_00210 [Phycisphaerales bacterium]|nr:MAG: hypothetical protein EA377_00210 [Phycisphaerales bacterium]